LVSSFLNALPWRRRRAIATLVIGHKAEALYRLCQPTFQAYARRIGADLRVIRRNRFHGQQVSNYFGKLELGRLLERYERVLYLDCDVMVSADTPDLFAEVPAETLGVYHEGLEIDRTEEFARIEARFGRIPGWTTARYFNSGVMVLGRTHRPLFDTPASFEMGTYFYDQTYLNWKAQSLHLAMHSLDRRFNGMYPYVATPEEALIAHYAGYGFHPPLNWRERPDPFPFKHHQMQTHLDRYQQRARQYFHPEQFVCDLGRLEPQPSGFNRIYSPPAARGVVAYGPFLPLAAGHYRVKVDYALESVARKSAAGTVFEFDLASESGARIWHKAAVDGRGREIVFDVQLPAIMQAETRFWAMGSPTGFFIDRVQLERLASP
jgi:hypothetical protein